MGVTYGVLDKLSTQLVLLLAKHDESFRCIWQMYVKTFSSIRRCTVNREAQLPPGGHDTYPIVHFYRDFLLFIYICRFDTHKNCIYFVFKATDKIK
jgi:hypothetical protein